MIKASISPLHETLFRPYILRAMRRQFNVVHLIGEVPEFGEWPILLLPNHSTWWDGFLIFLLKERLLHRPVYLMMLEEQLRKNRFFSRIGVYSIDPNSLRGNRESLLYTRHLLSLPEKPLVCIFPQGELLPWGRRPLGYRRGIELILRKPAHKVTVCLLAIKCEHMTNERADVFIQFGGCIEPAGAEALQQLHESLLDELSARIIAGEQGTILLSGKRSINESFEALRIKLGLLPRVKK